MLKITITEKRDVEVAFLKAECDVRYWEDATVNGVEDEDGSRIPCRQGDCWMPTIDLKTGQIQGWPEGTEASLHYKVCDAGRYSLLDAEGKEVAAIDGYVPKIMCPGGRGFGDYVIMKIDASGHIADWHPTLDAFEDDDMG